MSVHHIEFGHEAVADYATLLAEAADVLAAIAESEPETRSEELSVLQSIHAEGADSHRGDLVHATPGLDDALLELPGIVRSMFATVMAIGSALAGDTRASLPVTALTGTQAVEDMTRALSAALDGIDDPSEVELGAKRLAVAAHALDPSGPAPAAAGAGLDGLVSAARLAEAALVVFSEMVSS